MNFTGDLLKIAKQNYKFGFNTSKKIGYGYLKNSGERSRAILALLFHDVFNMLVFPVALKDVIAK